jgi:TonB-linked SusC/RagA family outer membrane protein
MKKNRLFDCLARAGWKKWVQIMKLTAFFILLFVIDVSASFSQSTKISIKVENGTLSEIFSKIEAQSEYRFFYQNEQIRDSGRKTIDVMNKNILDVVTDLLKGTELSCKLVERNIIIFPKSENPSDNLIQQTHSVTGKVTDSLGSSLPGVSVVVKGTANGTITDANGNYSLTNIPANATLQFSFVGMKTQEIPVSGKSKVNVTMIDETVGIDEVVAVGYGTQKKLSVTGSVASVKNKDIITVTSSNLTDNLSGRIPGLRIQQQTGEPGDYSSTYNIRGWGTALVIVDGVQRDDFVKIDPNEIESVSILKDASATVYGVKAANGVILINTKKGEKGRPKITFSSCYGFQKNTDTPVSMNAAQYTEIMDEAQMNAGSSLTYSEDDIEKYKNGTYKSTDWSNLVIRKYVPQQEHNLSISGGSEKIKYFSSIGYVEQQAQWKTKDQNYKRYNLRMNVTAQISDNLESELGLGCIADDNNKPYTNTWLIYKSMWMQKPTISVYANDDENYLSNVADGYHPLAATNRNISGYNDSENKDFQGNFAMNYKVPFINGLKARLLYSYDIYLSQSKKWKKKFSLYDYDSADQTYTETQVNSPSNLYKSKSELDKSTLQLSLNYEKSIEKKHNIKGLLLFEKINSKYDDLYGSKEFSVDAIDELYAGNSDNQSVSSTNGNYPYARVGFIGRLNYDYNLKYLLEANFRYDGSSKFAEGHRWGLFPGISMGWRISEEKFIKDNLPFLSNLKLRASWGKMGDDASSDYQFINGYTYPSGSYVFDNELISGLSLKDMANQNLTWYTSTTMNVGLEGNLWNNKLSFQFDLFRRERNDLLDTRELSLPSTVGASLPEENLDSDLSKGFELVLGHSDKIGQVSYNISVNLSYARTKNQHVEEAEPGNSYAKWTDSSSHRWSNITWGYKYIGQFQSFDEIYSSPIEDGDGNRKLLPGDRKYEDLNKDGIIDSNDAMPLFKGSTPEMNYGINLALQWKNFDISALFQGAYGFNVFFSEQFREPIPWGRNSFSFWYDRWHRSDLFDKTSEWVSGKYPSTRVNGSAKWNVYRASFNSPDGTYLRLKNLEIGYTIQAKYLKRIGIDNLRIYTNGYNLYTWKKIDYIDPEHTMNQYGYYYPITKNFNLGIKVTL